LATWPSGEPTGGWLYLHPFAEEMNKSRRMAALGAEALARRGWLVLQVDLGGCGDSAGEFGDATWQGWIDDVSQAWAWLRNASGGPRGIWSLRAGSLLAADWIAQTGDHPPLLLWQPVRNGQQHLTQFLRLKAASDMLTDKSKGAVARLREELDSGSAVEIAGYNLPPAIAAGMSASRLQLPANYEGAVTAIELVSGEQPGPTPGMAAMVRTMQEAGITARVEATAGPSFWQTVEIETAPSMIETTLDLLERRTA
jgi:exosortase A-associated hydrolase 2